VIRVELSEVVIARALSIARYENIMPSGSRDKSISGKGRNAVYEGALGQAVFEYAAAARKIPLEFVALITHDYESLAGSVEVKTKERAYVPEPHFEASLYSYNESWQQADWYAFVSLKLADGYTKESPADVWKYSGAWVMGCIGHQRLVGEVYEVRKGDELQNGQTAMFNSRNIKYSILEPIDILGGKK
jgi:hypothetical protein